MQQEGRGDRALVAFPNLPSLSGHEVPEGRGDEPAHREGLQGLQRHRPARDSPRPGWAAPCELDGPVRGAGKGLYPASAAAGENRGMKTSELTGAPLDHWVAKAQGWELSGTTWRSWVPEGDRG